MIFDLDYYTTKQVLVSQLRAKDWLDSAFHAIRRDSHTFLGGEHGYALGLMEVPSTEIFGIKDGVALQPEYTIRLEGSDLGVLTRIKAQELTISTETPPEIEEEGDKSGSAILSETITLHCPKSVFSAVVMA